MHHCYRSTIRRPCLPHTTTCYQFMVYKKTKVPRVMSCILSHCHVRHPCCKLKNTRMQLIITLVTLFAWLWWESFYSSPLGEHFGRRRIQPHTKVHSVQLIWILNYNRCLQRNHTLQGAGCSFHKLCPHCMLKVLCNMIRPYNHNKVCVISANCMSL